jgi:SAM-dependent methyltransferase
MMAESTAPPLPEVPWWETFFDDEYAAYGLANDPPEVVERMADFIMRTLDLQPGETLFDQCCGIGRISIPLAQRGLAIIGVELNDSYVRTARTRSGDLGLGCEFYRADAYEFIAPRPCDAAINWFTSFGYCADDEQNARMLRCLHASLRPGGRLLIDYINIPGVMAHFQPSMVDRPMAPGLHDVIVLHERTADFLDGMMNLTMTFLHPDGRRVARKVSTRAYMPHEIVHMLRRCGFENVRLFGSAHGEPFERTSRRCILQASRRAD